MSIDTKLKEMGLVLPKATDPVGSYVATKISGNLLYTRDWERSGIDQSGIDQSNMSK